jgi:hypothetical protein
VVGSVVGNDTKTADGTKPPSQRQIARAEKVVLIREREKNETLDFGCLVRPLARLHFPMTNPNKLPTPNQYVRRDGDREIKLVTTSTKYCLPYGQDLVALYGLCTRGRELYKELKSDWDGTISFSSTAEMLRYFGDPPTPQYYKRRMDSLLRLWHARLEIVDTLDRFSHRRAVKIKYDKADFLETVTAWFQLEERQIGMAFENVIQFTPKMIQWIREAPLFEDDKVFILKQCIGALQLYLLLRDRCADKALAQEEHGWIPVHGSSSLESQLGWVRQQTPRKVRWQINRWINVIKTVWPECPSDIREDNKGNLRLMIHYCPAVTSRPSRAPLASRSKKFLAELERLKALAAGKHYENKEQLQLAEVRHINLAAEQADLPVTTAFELLGKSFLMPAPHSHDDAAYEERRLELQRQAQQILRSQGQS